jgi:hypothetical protein
MRVSWMTNHTHLHKFPSMPEWYNNLLDHNFVMILVTHQSLVNSKWTHPFRCLFYLGNEQESPMIEVVVLNSPTHDCACWIYEGHDLQWIWSPVLDPLGSIAATWTPQCDPLSVSTEFSDSDMQFLLGWGVSLWTLGSKPTLQD